MMRGQRANAVHDEQNATDHVAMLMRSVTAGNVVVAGAFGKSAEVVRKSYADIQIIHLESGTETLRAALSARGGGAMDDNIKVVRVRDIGDLADAVRALSAAIEVHRHRLWL